MANRDADAELVVSVDDQASAGLAKIAAMTRTLGQQWGADAKTIDRATRNTTSAISKMAQSAGQSLGKTSPLAASIASTKRQMQELAELSYKAQGLRKTNTSFSGYTLDGKGIKADEARKIQEAARSYAALEKQLVSLTAAEERMARASRGRSFAADQSKRFTIDPATLNASARSAATLQQVYANMWQTVDNAPKRWWPPEALRSTENFTRSLMEANNATRYVMYDVARNFAIAGAVVAAFGTAAVVMAARWEAAFAQVERTTGASGATLERLRQGLIGLSQDLPVSFTKLTEIASVGAQMGIATDGIVAYTEVIAQLTATTNLTADAAGKALGRFKAFFAEADDPTLAVTNRTFSNLASSILKVGVNSVATETGIVNVATQISSMGSYAGFTADQVIGLAGALSSVGVPPELSRGVITRLFNTIGEAVSENGTKLQDFAELAGLSAEEFAASWGTQDFAYTFTSLIGGLQSVSSQGGDAVTVLHDLGITSVRDVPVLLRLAGAADEAGRAGGLLAQTMTDARSGWRDNIELALQYSKISQTVSARFQVLLQNFEALFATMGQGTMGPIKGLIDGFIMLLKGMTAIGNTGLGQTLGAVGTVAALTLGAILLLTAAFVRGGAAAIGFGQALQHVGLSAAQATPFVNGLRFAILGLGLIGILSAVVGGIVALSSAANDANNAIQDTQGALAAMQQDAQDGGGFFTFTQGLDGAKTDTKNLSTQAENLGKVLGHTTERMYGNAAAADAMASSTKNAALVYGRSSAEFSRAALTSQQAFTDLFKGDLGTEFADQLVANGFDLDKALTIAAKDGRKGVDKYMDEVFAGFGEFDFVKNGAAGYAEWSRLQEGLVDQLASTGEGWQKVANSAYATGDAFKAVAQSGEQLTDADFMTDFAVQNEDAINSMAKGFQGFVDSGSLIDLTRQMASAQSIVDDTSTELNESVVAVRDFESNWTAAFGGAAFSIEDYMVVFRRAATEQQDFIADLTTLAARGVPTNIIGDLAAMGPAAAALVDALVAGTDAQLEEYVALYGQTGFDSMVALAAGQLAAEQIVRNAAQTLSTAQLQQLSADLAAGTPLVDAMAKWQLDANGDPIDVPTKVEMDYYAEQRKLQAQAAALGFNIPITPYLTQTQFTVNTGNSGQISIRPTPRAGKNYWSGGYTGPGGMHDYAGAVHRGEFVHPKKDVDQSTGMPKPSALIRMLSGGRPARSAGGGGFGYAGGGYVGGANQVMAHLSTEDRTLLIEIRDAIGIYIGSDVLASAVNNSNTNNATRRAG